MDKKLKILFVVRTLTHGGGAERLIFDIYNELNKRNDIHFKIVVLQKSEIFKEYNISNADYYENKMKDIFYLNYKIKLSLFRKNKINICEYKNIVNEFKPDIIHSHLYLAELVSREYISNRPKYVTHVHDNIVQFRRFSIKTIIYKSLLTNYYERLRLLNKYKQTKTHFICISEETKKFIHNNLPKKVRKKTIILPNAIDLNRFSLIKKTITNDSCVQFISIGSLATRKNHLFLIDVIDNLKNKGYSVHLTILGEGVERFNIENKIQKLNLNNEITLKGNVSEIVSYLDGSNIYLHSAISEPFGLVLLEAMASGLPVVSLDGKGNRDIVKDNYNGFLIEDISIDLMCEKIIYLLNNKKEYERISQNAVDFSKKFSINGYADKLIDFYRSIIN
jgi:glycosyltransferase involved in cell wall biosynthesis